MRKEHAIEDVLIGSLPRGKNLAIVFKTKQLSTHCKLFFFSRRQKATKINTAMPYPHVFVAILHYSWPYGATESRCDNIHIAGVECHAAQEHAGKHLKQGQVQNRSELDAAVASSLLDERDQLLNRACSLHLPH